MTLKKRGVPEQNAEFAFAQPEPERLTLNGKLARQQIQAHLWRIAEPKFPLTSRGFHWINEYPFNR